MKNEVSNIVKVGNAMLSQNCIDTLASMQNEGIEKYVTMLYKTSAFLTLLTHDESEQLREKAYRISVDIAYLVDELEALKA